MKNASHIVIRPQIDIFSSLLFSNQQFIHILLIYLKLFCSENLLQIDKSDCQNMLWLLFF